MVQLTGTGLRSHPIPLYLGLGLEFAWWYWFMSCVNTLDPGLVAWCPRPLTGLQGLAMLLITLATARILRSDALQSRLDLPMSLLLLVASLLVGLPLGSEGASPRCGIALLLAALGTAWCYIRWSGIYRPLSVKVTLISAFSCFIVGTVLKVIMWVLPPAGSLAAACCCAVVIFPVAGWLARWAASQSAEIPSKPGRAAYTADTSFTAKVFVCLLVFSLVETVIPTALVVSTTASSSFDFLVEQAVVMVLSVLVIVWVVASGDEPNVGAFWKWLLGVTGVLCVLVAALPGFKLNGVLVHALFSVLWLFLWVTLVNAARISSMGFYRFVGLGSALSWIPYAVGSIIVQTLHVQDLSHSLLLASYVALSLTVIVCTDSRDTDVRAIFSSARGSAVPPEVAHTLEERCAALGAAHGLTEREIEVLGYLGRGRSRTFIAEALLISESTVKAHTTHLYRKLGVAGKQELLSLLEQVA